MPDTPLEWVSPSILATSVSRLLASGVSTIDNWSTERLVGGAGEALGVWRVSGTATVDGTSMPWTMILKGWPAFDGPDDPKVWNWPRREARAYGSGVLDDLPGGIRAPRCLGSHVTEDGSEWAWLAPLSDGAVESWTPAHFTLVSRHLGQFNGAYLTGHPLPDAPWLSYQWTRQWTEAASLSIEMLDSLTGDPLVSRACPPSLVRAFKRTWEERQAWYETLESLPQTFSHLDAFNRNIFLSPGFGGELETRLIDWGFAGIAAVGEEIAPMVAASIIFDAAPWIEPAMLDEIVFEGYLRGLRDAGWAGDEQLARMGYTGSVALRYGIGTIRVLLGYFLDVEGQETIEEIYGKSISDIADHAANTYQWAMEVGDEFRRHLSTRTFATSTLA